MSFIDRFRRTEVTLKNVEPNRVFTVGKDDISTATYDKRSEDWIKFAPPKIKPTIKNCRRAANFPTTYGIINNLIMKTISSFIIDGDDDEAVEHILEMDKIWRLKGKAYECLWKAIVDGEPFYEKIVVDNHCDLRLLAFDGEKALIKKYYDENSQLMGYKQLVVKKSAIKNWKGMDFWEDYQESQVVTVDFDVDEISNPQLLTIDGNGVSLVRNVIDIAYYIDSLARMMPSVVFKQADILVATIGNDARKETKMTKEARDNMADELSNYHKKGVQIVPYGVTLDVVGDNVLPKIQDYIKSLKAMLYEGLMTPESLYSSESSNRSTAQVQLTDPTTGHILFIEFCQEFLKEWLERDLINPELERAGFEEGSAYISFMTDEVDLDTNYLESGDGVQVEEDKPVNKEGSTAMTTDDEPYKTWKGRNDG